MEVLCFADAFIQRLLDDVHIGHSAFCVGHSSLSNVKSGSWTKTQFFFFFFF